MVTSPDPPVTLPWVGPVEHLVALATRLTPEMAETVADVLGRGHAPDDREAIYRYVVERARHVQVPGMVASALAAPALEWEDRLDFQNAPLLELAGEGFWTDGMVPPVALVREAGERLSTYIALVQTRLSRIVTDAAVDAIRTSGLRPDHLSLPPVVWEFCMAAAPGAGEARRFLGYATSPSEAPRLWTGPPGAEAGIHYLDPAMLVEALLADLPAPVAGT